MLFGLGLMMSAPVWADSLLPPAEYANKQLPDARLETRARDLMHAVRCLVCQGQSIADSDSDMAGDMRSHIRRRIAAGEQPEDIRSWLVERYGNWVTYDPPVKPLTWPLWGAPIALLAAGLWLMRGQFRRGSKKA